MAKCSVCGNPNEDFGLCEKCRTERNKALAQKASSEPRTSRRAVLTPGQFLLWGSPVFIAAFCLLSMLLVGAEIFVEKPVLFSEAKGFLKLATEDGTSELRYAFGSRASIDGYAYDVLVQSGALSLGGVLLQLHYLRPDAYSEFKRSFGNSNNCPAAFYNAHMQHTLVLSKDAACSKRLRDQSFKNWHSFSISGQLLNFHDGFNTSGPVSMPTGPFNYLLIDSCDQLLRPSE